MDLIPKAWAARAKIGKWDSVRMKSFYTAEGTESTEGEKNVSCLILLSKDSHSKSQKCSGKETVETDIASLKYDLLSTLKQMN